MEYVPIQLINYEVCTDALASELRCSFRAASWAAACSSCFLLLPQQTINTVSSWAFLILCSLNTMIQVQGYSATFYSLRNNSNHHHFNLTHLSRVLRSDFRDAPAGRPSESIVIQIQSLSKSVWESGTEIHSHDGYSKGNYFLDNRFPNHHKIHCPLWQGIFITKSLVLCDKESPSQDPWSFVRRDLSRNSC